MNPCFHLRLLCFPFLHLNPYLSWCVIQMTQLCLFHSYLFAPKVFIKIVQFYSTDLYYHLYYNLYSYVYLSLFICFLFCFFIGLFVYYGLPGWLNVKESTCNAGDIETQVRSLGWENPLEKEMATHSSILAWEIPWLEEPWGLQSMGSQKLDTTEWLNSNSNFISYFSQLEAEMSTGVGNIACISNSYDHELLLCLRCL